MEDSMESYEFMGIKRGYKASDKPEFQIVRNFIIKSEFSVSNFDKNLSTLIIDMEMNKKVHKNIDSYDAFNNRICGQPSGITFIHELFHMSSNINNSNDELGAMFLDGTGVSLNEGITEFLTSQATQGKNSYQFEVLFYEFISQMYPDITKEVLKKYFLGKPNELYDLFGEDREIILSAVRELDNYTKYNQADYISLMHSLQGIKTGSETENLGYNNIYESLTNAFSIILNHFKKKDPVYVEDLLGDFEDTAFDLFGEEKASEIMEMLLDKIDRNMEL